MFNHLPSDIDDRGSVEDDLLKHVDCSKDTLNPRNLFGDNQDDTFIIPDFKDGLKDQIYSNV